MFKRVAFVWTGEPAHTPTHAAKPGQLGIMALPHALGCDVLAWQGDAVPRLDAYDLFLVPEFGINGRHFSQIREQRPEARIIALPDPPPEHVFYPGLWGERHTVMLEQLRQADAIGARMLDGRDAMTYCALLDKPRVILPGPLVPHSDIEAIRRQAREPFILAADHSWDPVYSTAQVAALAAIQRQTGFKVRYVNDKKLTRPLAAEAGLKAEFVGRLPLMDFFHAVAQATLAVDLYAMHSMGRFAILCAYAGTPCVSSSTNTSTGHPQIDPWDVEAAVRIAGALLTDDAMRTRVLMDGYQRAGEYSPECTRQRVMGILEEEFNA